MYFSRTDGQVLYCSGSVDAPISVPAGYSGDLYHQGWRLMPYRLQLDVFVPKADIVRSLRETVTLYVGFTTAVLLLTLVIASLVYWRQLRPLRGMVDTMNRMASHGHRRPLRPDGAHLLPGDRADGLRLQ